MPTDLDRFYERDLDRTNIKDFYNSLPSRLQDKFRKSVKIVIAWGNVLQGYRGPSEMCNNGSGDSGVLNPSNGLQEIRYWWGARKDLNCQIPILGIGVFGLGRALQYADGSLEWCSIFFDSKTGECLSHDRNEAADQLHNRGCQLFREKEYSAAEEYFRNAYRSCSSGYRNEQEFKNDIDKAHNEVEAARLNSRGDELFRQGAYRDAFEQYSCAYVKSQDESQYGTYRANREKAQAEMDAMDLHSRGNVDFENGRYAEACSKFSEAWEKSSTAKDKSAYLISRNKVQTIVDALSSIGSSWDGAWDAESDGREEEAARLFQKVSSESAENAMKFSDVPKFKQYAALAALKIEGNQLFNSGLESQQRGIALLSEAQKMRSQQNFEAANKTFEDAKANFSNALARFAAGAKDDARFESCASFVRELIDEVSLSIRLTSRQSLDLGLDNLTVNADGEAGSREAETPVVHNQCHELL